jgi:hypothetical protein
MRKAIVSVSFIAALAGTGCVNKTSSPTTDQRPQAADATHAAPQVPAALPHADQKTPRSAAVANTKKNVRHLKVAKTVQKEATGQKSPVSEGIQRDGPG